MTLDRGLANAVLWALCALLFGSAARGAVPLLPTAVPVPPSLQLPLSSAERAGTEYSDLAKAGYVEEEYYLSGVAPAATAARACGDFFGAPLPPPRPRARKPQDAARFNGTVVIEPFTWFGERGAGWIL